MFSHQSGSVTALFHVTLASWVFTSKLIAEPLTLCELKHHKPCQSRSGGSEVGQRLSEIQLRLAKGYRRSVTDEPHLSRCVSNTICSYAESSLLSTQCTSVHHILRSKHFVETMVKADTCPTLTTAQARST